WGFGGSVVHDPDKPEESKAWIDFPKQHGLPKDHWWHIHNMFLTYRALASRYGDPRDLLTEDWIAHIPGISAPGKYEDYAKDPWKTFSEILKKVEAGTYDYFYPPVKPRK
ncbi:MAG: hypothetical protein HW373_1455, partial [Deltaproteobacteria bacterium]|nr:hypothetical protein [Deltaproteobacteria bacterium]